MPAVVLRRLTMIATRRGLESPYRTDPVIQMEPLWLEAPR